MGTVTALPLRMLPRTLPDLTVDERRTEIDALCEIAEALGEAAERLPINSEWRKVFVNVRGHMLSSADESSPLGFA